MNPIISIDHWRRDLAVLIQQKINELYPQAQSSLAVEEIFEGLERPPQAELGDYALPCFKLAAPLKCAPPKIAQELARNLAGDFIERVEAKGPFLNVFLKLPQLAHKLFEDIITGEYFKIWSQAGHFNTQKTMIEFSQPNTHKTFHVGHVRNMCLGDCLVRLMRYLGYPVIAANYYGDEGTHVAKCVWYLKKQGLKPPFGVDKGAWLGEVYRQSTCFLDEASEDQKKVYQQEISEVLRQIEQKSGEYYALWQETRSWSLEHFRSIYEWMDVHFDHEFYESELTEESQKLVDEFLEKGVFVVSQGAVGIDLNEDQLGFLILRKKDGNTLYATKDLALAKRKFEQFGITLSIYVVGSEQNLHFKQVFKTLEKMGFSQAKNCYHLSYGHVRLPQGKMSSRKGSIVSLAQLSVEMQKQLEKQLEKYRDQWSGDEIVATVHKLAIAAIRYGMLATDPQKDVVYNQEDWLSFQGHSGVYLCYSYARCQSILQKAADQHIDFGLYQGDVNQLGYLAIEKELIKALYDFNLVVFQAVQQYKPSILCHRLYELAQLFSRFYNEAPVLKLDDASLQQQRLKLIQCYATLLGKGLDLLGIKPPQRM